MSDYRDREVKSTVWDKLRYLAEKFTFGKAQPSLDLPMPEHTQKDLNNFYLKNLSGYENTKTNSTHDDKIDIWKKRDKKK